MSDDAVPRNVVGKSPFGDSDEIGRLNLISPESRSRLMARVDGSRIYDLSVDYFIGMPTWVAAADPPYQIWMTHTPHGTCLDGMSGQPREVNERMGYSGDAILMYTHCGTHIDALNHWAHGETIYNGYEARDHLGSRHWRKNGSDRIPPMVARGILLDVAATKGVTMLPDSYPITPEDLEETAAREDVRIEEGDIVLIRTGRMTVWNDADRYLHNTPGINVRAAQWLVEGHGAIALGADQCTLEYLPSIDVPGNYNPVHLYLVAEQGVPILEVLWLEELARDQVYEFAFFGAPLRLRGSTGSPIRPWVMPLL